jgi:pimeloyl-ACP methyl ester carboxylesterase
VIAAVALSSVGAAYETVTRASEQPAPGTLYDVGGHRLHIDCAGTGSPTVVFQNGLGQVSVSWSRITQQVSRTTRVCVYDRAGQGWSDDVTAPQDGVAIADDLHTLLERSGEEGPYVIVGHSAGGPYSMIYADRYPDDVAGMVLLDSMSPDAFTDLPGFATEQSMMHRGLGVLPSLTRLGAGRILPTSAWSSLPEPAASQVQAHAASSRGMRNMRDEQSMFPEVFAQARELASLDARPLVVLVATESIDKHHEWVDLQERLADLSTNSLHRIVDATHAGLVDDAASTPASVQAITDVVHSIRTGQPVAAR